MSNVVELLHEWIGPRTKYVTFILRRDPLDADVLDIDQPNRELNERLKNCGGATVFDVFETKDPEILGLKVLITPKGIFKIWNAICFRSFTCIAGLEINNLMVHTYSNQSLELWSKEMTKKKRPVQKHLRVSSS
jgi:hypothetical protein